MNLMYDGNIPPKAVPESKENLVIILSLSGRVPATAVVDHTSRFFQIIQALIPVSIDSTLNIIYSLRADDY